MNSEYLCSVEPFHDILRDIGDKFNIKNIPHFLIHDNDRCPKGIKGINLNAIFLIIKNY